MSSAQAFSAFYSSGSALYVPRLDSRFIECEKTESERKFEMVELRVVYEKAIALITCDFCRKAKEDLRILSSIHVVCTTCLQCGVEMRQPLELEKKLIVLANAVIKKIKSEERAKKQDVILHASQATAAAPSTNVISQQSLKSKEELDFLISIYDTSMSLLECSGCHQISDMPTVLLCTHLLCIKCFKKIDLKDPKCLKMNCLKVIENYTENKKLTELADAVLKKPNSEPNAEPSQGQSKHLVESVVKDATAAGLVVSDSTIALSLKRQKSPEDTIPVFAASEESAAVMSPPLTPVQSRVMSGEVDVKSAKANVFNVVAGAIKKVDLEKGVVVYFSKKFGDVQQDDVAKLLSALSISSVSQKVFCKFIDPITLLLSLQDSSLNFVMPEFCLGIKIDIDGQVFKAKCALKNMLDSIAKR